MKNEDGEKIIYPPIPAYQVGIGPIPMPIITDPFGSYTGLTKEPDEKPVQDADDL